MQCSLHSTEFSRVSSCSRAKEIWDRLMVIYEGTSAVKETKANMLVSEYEAFRMKHDETISEMYGRLTLLTNELKNLGKVYTDKELVRNILSSLTPIWHTKATVIEESIKLSTTTVDELIGSLITYELGLRRTEDDLKKKKPLALKASPSTKEATEDSDSSTSEDVSGEFTLITRKFRKFLRKQDKGFLKKKPYTNNLSKPKVNTNKKTNRIVCYKCRKPGYVKSECPEVQKKNQPGWNRNKHMAMVGTWSEEEEDEEEESSDAKDTHSRLCLMAREKEEEEGEVSSLFKDFNLDDWEHVYFELMD
ncbi:hypothetical protein Taro_004328 [Colocasia esculenta]|uniref:CCHC-type domain-containing protein n=1 Tax=Colocasia esculenta TaxID=4460 RepID=A0A843TLP7_COLES|nr:hypothetical protein [Colocasia esculenta]